MMKSWNRCVIIGGAKISNYEKIKEYFRDDDFYIFCDSGLKHQEKLGVLPNLIVGDFDSYHNPRLDIETIVLPREKDDTDTSHAVNVALDREFDNFFLLGVMGQRMDHSLGNITIMMRLDSVGKTVVAVDDYSEMEIVNRDTVSVQDTFAYFSLICLGDIATGVTIENAKFPLTNGTITPEDQYAVSNEVLPNKKAIVSLKSGRLLLIKIFK